MRLSIVSTLALVALGSLGLHITPLSDAGAAQAAEEEGERDKKQERRVLKMDDLDKQTLSEVYRAKAREKRHESIAFLKDILANRAPQGEQKAEMMLRLADLYFEEGRDLYLTEMQTYETAYDKCFNTPGCNPETMKADNTTSYKWQSRSIKLYKQILRRRVALKGPADDITGYAAYSWLAGWSQGLQGLR